jgi:hypothetical protein
MFRNFLPVALLGLVAVATVPAQTVPIASGRTSVTLTTEFLGALTSLQVRPGTIGQGRLMGAVLSYPITQGSMDASNARGEVFHTGGLSLEAGTTTRVQLLNFTIETTGNSPILTGLVVVNNAVVGRIPLFALQLPSGLTLPLSPRGGALVELNNVGVVLSRDAAEALNGVFRVTAFQAGFRIGTASVRALLDTDAIPAPAN